MFPMLNSRLGHYLILALVGTILCFFNLGTPSLWDIDEGNNAEAAREMLESENWTIPTFNYQLRVDKPALLYWLQIGAYRLFGINEFAARFPSATAALLTLLLTYELARRMFGKNTGLLAGIILASSPAFCAAAHFANPDALLNACTVLTFLIFWIGMKAGRGWWYVSLGVGTGLAMLAKGPVGLILPGSAAGLYLLSSGRLKPFCKKEIVWSFLAFAMVAFPWYILVSVDTKISFLRGFIMTHNVGRFLNTMENHRGPIFYYPIVLAAGFAIWSVFLGQAIWFASGSRARSDVITTEDSQYRYLWCWIAVYFVFFSVSSTKLPNYILPIYAPIAIMIGRFLERWRSGAIQPPRWMAHVSMATLLLIGIGLGGGLLVAAGVIDIARFRGRELPGLGGWAILGSVPIVAATAGWMWLRARSLTGLIYTVAAAAVLLAIGITAGSSTAVDRYKAPKALVLDSETRQSDQEIRIGCYEYFQPSLVFYCRREIQRLENEKKTIDFLNGPLPSYLFLPATVWDGLEAKLENPHTLLARHYDLYRHCEVVVVSNR